MAWLWHPHGVDANTSASMTQRPKYFFVFLSAVAVFAMGLGLGSEVRGQVQNKTDAKIISLGMISESNRARVEDHFHDFVTYVARRLTPGTSVEGKVALAATPFQLVKLLEQRRVDFFLESPYPTYIIDYVHGAGKPILRRWKSGMTEYQSVIVTRAGGIKRLEDLRGKTIAFEDPGSTSGYLLAKSFLLRSGFKLLEKPRSSRTRRRRRCVTCSLIRKRSCSI